MGKQTRQQRVSGAQTENPGHHDGPRYERPFEWWAKLGLKQREIFLTNSLRTADELRRLHPELASKAMGSIARRWLLPPDTDVLSLSRRDQWQAYRATQKFASVIRRELRAAQRHGRARAFLSDRYRPLDHYDLAEVVLPALSDVGAEVQSCEITETKMYIKGVVSSRTVTVPPPPNGRGYGSGYRHEVAIAPGIVISNSEVGLGALAIQPAVHFLACTNMAVWAQHALRKYHVGRNLADGSEQVWRFLSNRTRELSDAALWAQVRDLAMAAFKGDVFEAIVNDLREARDEPIVEVVATVERLAERKGLISSEQSGVLSYLIEGGDLSKFGLSNAVTRFSQDVESYDRASQLEILGGEVIALPKSEWALIAA